MRVMAADSRVSPVSALNAKPRTAMFCRESGQREGNTTQKGKGGYLVCDCVEEGVDDALREAMLLVFVQGDDLTPISCHFGKVETLGKVNEVENVLLEAGPPKADRGPQKLGPNTRVLADRVGDFLDIGTRRLAYGGQRVDRRDALG
jgi:hypothetical protein